MPLVRTEGVEVIDDLDDRELGAWLEFSASVEVRLEEIGRLVPAVEVKCAIDRSIRGMT